MVLEREFKGVPGKLAPDINASRASILKRDFHSFYYRPNSESYRTPKNINPLRCLKCGFEKDPCNKSLRISCRTMRAL